MRPSHGEFGKAVPSSFAAAYAASDFLRPPQGVPDIIAYCYDSRLVYVTPGQSYDVRPCLSTASLPFFFFLVNRL